MIYIDSGGIEYSVAPVTGRNSWFRDDLDGLEGQAFIVCQLGDVPLEGAVPRHSEARAEKDLEELAQKNGWFTADQYEEFWEFTAAEIKRLEPELY